MDKIVEIIKSLNRGKNYMFHGESAVYNIIKEEFRKISDISQITLCCETDADVKLFVNSLRVSFNHVDIRDQGNLKKPLFYKSSFEEVYVHIEGIVPILIYSKPKDVPYGYGFENGVYIIKSDLPEYLDKIKDSMNTERLNILINDYHGSFEKYDKLDKDCVIL